MKKFSLSLLICCLVVFGIAGVKAAYDEVTFDIVYLNSLRFFNSNGAHYTEVVGNQSINSNPKLTLPTTNGTTITAKTGAVTNGHVALWNSNGDLIDGGTPGGTGTVTSVSVVTANGVSGSVANPTSTPAITLTLGNITPTSVAATNNITTSAGSMTANGNITSQTGNLVAGTANSSTGKIVLNNATGINSTSLQAGASAPSLNYILPTASPSGTQFLVSSTPSGSDVQLSWSSTIGGYQGINNYEMMRDFNASGSAVTTTGTINATTTTLTVASASTYSQNQGILIAGAGAAGADYIGTITNVTGTTITVSPAASTSVVAALVQHDDTVAFRNAVVAMQAAGNKNVLVKQGTYFWNAPLDPACNALVCLPQVTRISGSPYSIGFIGEAPGYPMGSGVVPTNGAIISSNRFNGTVSNFSAQISAKTYAGTSVVVDTTFNYVQVIIENITFRNPANPTLTAIGMHNAEGLILRNVTVDNSEALTFTSAGGFSDLTQPTNANSVAIQSPGINNIGLISFENVWVQGYKIAYQPSDNTIFKNVYAIQNGICMQPVDGVAVIKGAFGFFECTTIIDATAGLSFGSTLAMDGQIEALSTTGGKWYDTPDGQVINDPSNLLSGTVTAQQGGTSAQCAGAKTGGIKLKYLTPFNDCYDFTGTSTRFTITQTGTTEPSIAGQLLLKNDSGDFLSIGTFGSAYSIAADRRNAIVSGSRTLFLASGSAFAVDFQVGANDVASFVGSNTLTFNTDSTSAPAYSIGRSGNRLNFSGGTSGYQFFASGGATVNAALDNSAFFRTISTGGFCFSSSSSDATASLDTCAARNAAGIIAATTGSGTTGNGAFDGLIYYGGGTTSSFPLMKRSAATFAFRLGDDSADAGITASTGSFSGVLTVSNGTSAAPSLVFTRQSNVGFYSNATNDIRISYGGSTHNIAFIQAGSTSTVYTDTLALDFVNGDAVLARFGAGIMDIQSAPLSPCSTPSNCRDLTLRHSLANGTAPTIASGFGTGSTIAGRDEAMRITLGTTPGTGGVVTFGTAYTNAPVCSAVDETTLTVTLTTTPTTTNVTVTSVAGVILASDKIGIICRSYL